MKKRATLFALCILALVPDTYGQFTKSFNSGGIGNVSFGNDIHIKSTGIDTFAVVRGLQADTAITNYIKDHFLGDVTTKEGARTVFNMVDTAKDIPATGKMTFESLKADNKVSSLSAKDIMTYIDTAAGVSQAIKDVVKEEHKFKIYYDAVGISNKPTSRMANFWSNKCDTIIDILQALRSKLESTPVLDSNAEALNKRADSIDKKIALYRSAYQFFKALNALEGTPQFKRCFFPLRSVAQASYFYFDLQGDKATINMLSNFALQTDANSKYAVSADILSGVFPVWSRLPLKLDIGTTIAQDKDSATENKAASKVLYGGLVHASLTYPLFFSNWDYWEGKCITVYVPLAAAINFDNVDEGSQLIKDAFYFGDVSASLYLKSDLLQSTRGANTASIFVNGRFSFISGGSKFYDNLPGDRQGFFTLQLNTGIKIVDRYTLALNFPLWSSNQDLLKTQNATIALIIDPNFGKKK